MKRIIFALLIPCVVFSQVSKFNFKKDIVPPNPYKFSAQVKTDNFTGTGEKLLGAFSYGYSEYNLTINGPLIPGYPKLRFFVSASNLFQRSPAGFYKGIDLKNVSDPTLGNQEAIDIFYPDNYQVNSQNIINNLKGNLSWRLQPITLRFKFDYTLTNGKNGVGITDYNSRVRTQIHEGETYINELKLSHQINPKMFYDFSLGYRSYFQVDMDPVFRHNFPLYGDSVANAKEGYAMLADSRWPSSIPMYGFSFIDEPRGTNFYEKDKNESINAKANFVAEIMENYTMKSGFEIDALTIRHYDVEAGRIAGLTRSVGDGDIRDIYRANNYGYDIFGNETNSRLDAAKKPFFTNFYINNEFTFKNMSLDAGLRADYVDLDQFEFKPSGGIIFDEERLAPREVDPEFYLYPNISISYKMKNIIYYAKYDQYVDTELMSLYYLGAGASDERLKNGSPNLPIPIGLKPERSTNFKFGTFFNIGNWINFDLNYFSKSIEDRIVIRPIHVEPGLPYGTYYGYINDGDADYSGFNILSDMHIFHRLKGTLNYTLNTDEIDIQNNQQYSLLVNTGCGIREHTLLSNFDYRFGQDDGPVIFGSQPFSQFGANLILAYASGFNSTALSGFDPQSSSFTPFETITSPSVLQMDLKLDKSFHIGPATANISLRVINLLNKKNVIGVFPATGKADDNGWLNSDNGQAIIQAYKSYSEEAAENYQKIYSAITYNPAHYGPPRQIQLGLRLDF